MALKNLFVTTILTSYFTIIYYHHITFIYYHHNECNIIDTLCDQLNKFSPNDMIFIGGDFNSRIGTQNDFIIGNEKDLNYLPQDYQLDTIRLVRNNQDTSVNENGQQLLDLRALDICRLHTVDLVLASEVSLKKTTIVQYVSVQDFNFLSDCRPILLKLTRNYNFLTSKIIKDIQICELKHKPTRYIWKNSLGKDLALRLSLERNKISKVPLGNESDTNFRSEIERTLGQTQNES